MKHKETTNAPTRRRSNLIPFIAAVLLAFLFASAPTFEGSIVPIGIVQSVHAQTYDPGARFVIDETSTFAFSTEIFQTAVATAVGEDSLTVTVGTADPQGTAASQDALIRYQVNFTFNTRTVELLTKLRNEMNNPQSAGYTNFNVFYSFISGTYYGISDIATTTMTTTTTTTAPPTTSVPVSWFMYTVQLGSSTDRVDAATFTSLISAIVGQPAGRTYIMNTLYFNFINENVTATFKYYDGTNGANVSQPDLVALLRKQMMATSPSPQVVAFRNQFSIVASDYINYSPTIPKIIVTVTGTNTTLFLSSISGSVSCSKSRIQISNVRVVPNNAQLWNFTFTFSNDGAAFGDSRNSLALALELQAAFFFTDQKPFTDYLAALRSPSQYFEELTPLIATTTTTTAAPAPYVRSEITVQYFTQSSPTQNQMTNALADASGLPFDRFAYFSFASGTTTGVNTVSFVQYFTPNVTSTDLSPADMMLTLMEILTSNPATTSRLVFEATFPIKSQQYYGYTRRPLVQPWIWIITVSDTANTANIINAVSSAVGVPTTRIGDVSVIPAGTRQWNFTFRYTLPPTDSDPAPLPLTLQLQQVFFDGSNAQIIALNSSGQHYENIPQLTTPAPIVNKDCEWQFKRAGAVKDTDFTLSISRALDVPTSRVVIISNTYVVQAVTATIKFTFTDVLEGTPQSRYNLSYQLMVLRFRGDKEEAYTLYLATYNPMVYESYGDWIVMLTIPPPNYNPVITFTMLLNTFNINNFKQMLALALGTTVDRVDTIGLNEGGTPKLFNYSFQFSVPVDNTTATAESLVEYLYLMMLYRRDDNYFTYLQPFNIIQTAFPNFPSPTQPGENKVSIVVQMKSKVVDWFTDPGSGKNITTVAYIPVNMTEFRDDMSNLVSAKPIRFAYYDPSNLTSGAQMGLYFHYLPVADKSKPTALDLTKLLQYNLAARQGPNIALVYERYNITAKRFEGVDGITDAPPTTTRNPFLPPDPNFYSPYGPAFNRSGLTDAPSLEEDTSNKTLIYAVVFGCLGAIILAAAGTVVVKVVLNKKSSHKATKYAQV